jgi:NADP-dependent 3-hydroxy acid dehydrogenase YdfG
MLRSGIDLTHLHAARAAMEAIQQRFGGIDALVNVAGGFRWQTLQDGEVETWDLLYTLNLKTAVTACKAVLPILTR